MDATVVIAAIALVVTMLIASAPAVCGPNPPGCTPTSDSNSTHTFPYGSAALDTTGEVELFGHSDWLPAGSYGQYQVDGSANCALTGSMTLDWATYDAVE